MGTGYYDKDGRELNYRQLRRMRGRSAAIAANSIARTKTIQTAPKVGDNAIISEGEKVIEAKVVELPTGQKVALGVREVTPAEQAARDFKPSESPYRKEYVEPIQRKSYVIPESEKIKPVIIGEKVAGFDDTAAKQSVGLAKGQSVKLSDLFEIEQYRARLKETIVEPPKETITKQELPKGTVTLAEKPKGFIGSLEDTAARLEYKSTLGKGISRQTQAFGAFGFAAAASYIRPILKPKETIIGTFQFGKALVTDPFGTGSEIYKQATTSPAQFTGNIAGGILFGKTVEYVLGKVYKSDPEVSIQDVVTKRKNTDTITLDETSFSGEVRIGFKKLKIKGEGTQEFRPLNENQYVVGGKANYVINKKTGVLEYRGISTIKEGGFDTSLFGKTKTTEFVQTTSTAEVVTEPFQSFQSYTRQSKVIGKGIYDIEPVGTSVSATKELYVRDIFTGKNMFRKEIKLESGNLLSSEQILSTGEVYGKTLPAFKRLDLSKTFAERQVFSGGSSVDVPTKSVVVQEVKIFSSAPTQESVLVQAISQDVKPSFNLAVISKAALIPKSITVPQSKVETQSFVSTGYSKAYPLVEVETTAIPKVNVLQKQNISAKQSFNFKPSEMQIQKQDLGLSQLSKQNVRQSSKQEINVSTKSMQDVGISTKQVQETKQIQDVKQALGTKQILNLKVQNKGIASFVPPVTPPPFRPEVAFMFQKSPYAKKGKKDKTKSKKVKNIYTPSLEAAVFNIRMPRRKISERLASTGLVVRPIQR